MAHGPKYIRDASPWVQLKECFQEKPCTFVRWFLLCTTITTKHQFYITFKPHYPQKGENPVGSLLFVILRRLECDDIFHENLENRSALFMPFWKNSYFLPKQKFIIL